MMNNTIKDLAYEAGFALWEHEEYRPPDVVVDWSSVYDDELVKFAQLVAKRCAVIASLMEQDGRKNIGSAILDHFEVPREQ
jgi:hypothetical protein